MWAIVEIGKKQYKVKEGDILQVERLKGENSLIFDKVLVFSGENNVKFGTPYIEGVKVKAEIVEEKKGDKVIIYKFRRRKKYRKKTGHRQIYTFLKISQITERDY
jgi:large subunit ribosomal protein L21